MNVTHLECAACGTKHEAQRLHNLCTQCGKPLLVRYDLKRAAASLTKESLRDRGPDLWRYREVLPIEHDENIVTLGEVPGDFMYEVSEGKLDYTWPAQVNKLLRDGGELGHTVLVYDGIPCQGTCTGRGHLEAYVSGTAATKLAQEAFGPAVDAHRLVRLAVEGDSTAIEILDGIGRKLGAAIGSFVNIFRPQLVVIGGGFASAGDLLLEPARQTMRREALPPAKDLAEIVRAELGTAAGLIGAAFVAYDELDLLEDVN